MRPRPGFADIFICRSVKRCSNVQSTNSCSNICSRLDSDLGAHLFPAYIFLPSFLPSSLPRKPSIARVMLQHAARNNPLSLSPSACLKPRPGPPSSRRRLPPPSSVRPTRRSASIEAHRGFAHTLRGRRICTVSQTCIQLQNLNMGDVN